jgi:hypothetical protein
MEEIPVEMSPRTRRTTLEVEGAKKDVAEGIQSVRESRESLDITIQQILLIQVEAQDILEHGSRDNGGENAPSIDRRKARQDRRATR